MEDVLSAAGERSVLLITHRPEGLGARGRRRGAPVIAPSGEQIEIAFGDQRATVVEVGGGLRTYSAAGRELVDGYGIDEMSSSGRGQVLIPWPNRLQDGSYEFDGQRHQLPIDDVEEQDAIHGLVRWAAWTAGEREPHRVVMEHLLHPRPGYPFSLALAIEYRLSEEGLRVTTTATNAGRVSCPFGSGAHPYLTLGTRDRGLADPARARANGAAVRRARHPRRLGSRSRARTFDFRRPRTIGATKLDNAFTDLERDDDGLARVQLRDPRGGSELTLWVDESYPVPDAFHRRPATRCGPARSRGRAHDLSAERVPQRDGPGPPRARPVVHRQVGHSSRASARLERPPCSTTPFATTTAVDSGTSSQAPDRSASGSETTTRSPSLNRWRRSLSGWSRRTASRSADTKSVRELVLRRVADGP